MAEVDERDRPRAVGRREAPVGVDACAVGQLPVPDRGHALGQLDGEPHPQWAAGMVADPPRMVALAPPVVELVGGALVGVGAVKVPDCTMWLWSQMISFPARMVPRRSP